MSTGSVITNIWNGVVKDAEAVENWVNTQVAAIEKALPGSTAAINDVVNDVKQAAGDALDAVDSGLNAVAPALTKSVEVAADAALTSYTGGLALPLTGLTNDGIEKVSATLVAAANAWELKAKAALAVNNGNAVASAVGPG